MPGKRTAKKSDSRGLGSPMRMISHSSGSNAVSHSKPRLFSICKRSGYFAAYVCLSFLSCDICGGAERKERQQAKETCRGEEATLR